MLLLNRDLNLLFDTTGSVIEAVPSGLIAWRGQERDHRTIFTGTEASTMLLAIADAAYKGLQVLDITRLSPDAVFEIGDYVEEVSSEEEN